MKLLKPAQTKLLVGIAFFVGVGLAAVPAQVLASHLSSPAPTSSSSRSVKPQSGKILVSKPKKENFVLAFLSGFGRTTQAMGRVLGVATEAAVEGTGSIFNSIGKWLSGLFGGSTGVATESAPLTTTPGASPKPSASPSAVVTAAGGSYTAGDGISIKEYVVSVVASMLAGTGLKASNNNLNVDVGTAANQIPQLDVNAQMPKVAGKFLTDLDASNIAHGTIKSDYVTGNYTGITGLGTITNGTWNGSVISDTYIANDLTLSGASFTGAGGFSDDVKLTFGSGAPADILWETADANANELLVAFDEGGATDVPVLVVGDASADNVDLGMFNGVADPSIAVVSDDAGDYGRMFVTDAGVFTFLSGTGDIALQPDADTGDYFTFSSDGTNLTLGTTDAAGLTVTNSAGLAAATVIVSTAGGIDISTGSGAAGNDIDILGGSSVNLRSTESVADSITIITLGAAGGIDLSTGGQLGQGGAIDILSGNAAAAALTLVTPQGGIDISTGGATQNIDILSGAGANLVAISSGIDISTGGNGSSGGSIDILGGQGAATAITIVAPQGGIDISTGSATQDIDILGGASLNLRSTEAAADSITIITNGSSGGIDISTGGQLGQGGTIDILSGNAAAAALTLVAPQGGIDISTGSGAAGNDIDILGGSSVNLRSTESVADSITIITLGAAGGIDLSTGGQLGQGGTIDILSGNAAAAALTLVTPQGGIDISTGSGAAGNDIDILSGSSINLTAAESAVDSIVLTSTAGGIDILATGAAAGEDIDIIATGSSVNLRASESVADAITIIPTGAAGGIDLSTGGQAGQGGSIDILGGQGAATAITIVAPQGGIDISTGSATQDIDILGGASVNLRSTEAAADSITIITNGSSGGIDISTGGQLGQGGTIDLLSGNAAAAALTLVAPQGGIDISTGTGTAGNDIDLLAGASINLSSLESVADAITLTTNSAAGGIDLSTGGQLGKGGSIDILSGQGAATAITIVAPQGGIDISTGSATQDIDILGGASVNLRATESAADAITIFTLGAAGGIDLSTGGNLGQGGTIDLLSGNAAAAALTLVAPQGGIDISTGTGTAGNDIDLLAGASINLSSLESVADAITLTTNSAAGGIDLSTGGQLGKGGSIDILSGQGAATAITIVAPQGGIDISTGSETADIDILGGDNINITSSDNTSTAVNIQATSGGLSVSGGADTVNSSGMVITSANVNLYGDVLIDMTATATQFGVCHSGAASDTVAYNRTLVVCSGAPADLAEWYETKPGVGAGDVVVLSGETIEYSYTPFDPFTGTQVEGATRTEKVSVLKVSEGTYSPYLVGVVSTSPYQVFGTAIKEVAKNPQPIALSGRVPVKVNNENGPIAVGDYLTSSSTSGYAMRASKGGMVVGTALEAFDGTTGQIMVFVGRGYVADGVYEQMALLAALGAVPVIEASGEVLGVSTATTEETSGASGGMVAQTEGSVLAEGGEPLPVVKAETLDELTVTTAATFEGTLLVLGNATFEGMLTVNGVEVKGDLNVAGAVTVPMTAGGSVNAGDPVAVNGDGSVSRASGGRPVVGVAASAAGAGSVVRVAVAGRVGGLSGLSAGVRYFVDSSGALTSVPEGNQALGVAVSGSELLVQVGLGYPGGEVVAEPTPEASATPEPTPSPSPEPVVTAPEVTVEVPEASIEPSPTPLPSVSPEFISPLP